MSKRFTDANKWRKEWFRTLPIKAKLAWIYLCDECESHGVIKIDYGLASFQLGFPISSTLLAEWFDHKIHFLNNEQILIVGFFEFQYGASKNTWSAKVRAREKLENLGFSFDNDILIDPKEIESTTVVPRWGDSVPTRLIRVRGRVRVSKKESLRENKSFTDALENAYLEYPRKKGKSAGFKKAMAEFKTTEDLENLQKSIKNYKAQLVADKTEAKFVKHFSTFMSEWKDWLNVGKDQDFSQDGDDKYKRLFAKENGES